MRIWQFALAAILAVSYAAASAQTTGSASGATPTIVTMDNVKWTPGTGMMKGVDVAVLVGDPSKSGPYTMRLRIPANTKVPPHYHADTENVTILSGALWFGLGDKFNESTMREYGAGTFASIPANVHHYVMTKTETIIQIHGEGPSSMTAVSNM